MTKAMIDSMSPGSVIVDLAAETGGNAEGSVAGETITTENGVIIWGGKDVPSQLPNHASMLFSRNVVNLLGLLVKSAEGKAKLNLDFNDEIIDAAAVTHNGSRRSPEGKK